MANAKGLVAFDFDHTIVDDNTDTVVISLLDKSLIPDSVKELYRSDGWTSYMQAIFDLLDTYNIDKKKILQTIADIPFVKGFDTLIRALKDELQYDIIIISDSNSCFIDTWLETHNLTNYFCKVFTNPAQFVDNSLKIQMYHLQTHCKLSTKNLCKGQILEDFIETQKNAGIIYDRVAYVGDGTNDFCPVLKLKENDLACARENYKCADLVKLAIEGKYLDETGNPYMVKAIPCIWKTGLDILNAVKMN